MRKHHSFSKFKECFINLPVCGFILNHICRACYGTDSNYYSINSRRNRHFSLCELLKFWINGELTSAFFNRPAHSENLLDKAQSERLMNLRNEELEKVPEAAVRKISNAVEIDISDEQGGGAASLFGAKSMAGAFPGKMDTGIPSGNAQKQRDRAISRFEEKRKRLGLAKRFRGFRRTRKTLSLRKLQSCQAENSRGQTGMLFPTRGLT